MRFMVVATVIADPEAGVMPGESLPAARGELDQEAANPMKAAGRVRRLR